MPAFPYPHFGYTAAGKKIALFFKKAAGSSFNKKHEIVPPPPLTALAKAP
jgi:hypothetical protein